MEHTYNVTNRKALVTALGELLDEKPRYAGMPSAAYQISDYTVHRDGSLEGPDDANLIAQLAERGFIPEPEAEPAPSEEPADVAPQEADNASDVPAGQAPDEIVIEYPLDGFNPEKLDNLTRMVTAKEELIKLALCAQTLPIQVLDDRIAFPWLQTTDPQLVDALAAFIAALCKTALEKKRVTATPQPTGINDRYRLRCFMLQIGMIGSEYAQARKKLLAPLSGNSGWLNGPPPTAEDDAEEGESND